MLREQDVRALLDENDDEGRRQARAQDLVPLQIAAHARRRIPY
jgi:hypothetical protein